MLKHDVGISTKQKTFTIQYLDEGFFIGLES